MTRSICRIASATLAIAVLTAHAGCGQSPSGGDSATGGGAPAAGSNPSPPAVKTASKPGDACAWVPVADVEEIVGKLDAPPRAAGNECIYTLAEKSATFTGMVEFRRKMREIDGIKSRDDDDRDLASLLRVTVDPKGGSIVGDLATKAVGKMFAKELGQRPSEAAQKDAPPAGWDAVGGLPYTWIGRVGHISISVYSPPEIATEKKLELAARVRDCIPDLPFPAENTY